MNNIKNLTASFLGYSGFSGDDPSQFVKDAYKITDEIIRQGNL